MVPVAGLACVLLAAGVALACASRVHVRRVDRVRDAALLDLMCDHLFREFEHVLTAHLDVASPAELSLIFRRAPERMLFVAARRGRFVGCCGVTRAGDTHWVSDVYVVPEERRRGVGSALVRHATHGRARVALHAEADKVAFYEALGFRRGDTLVSTGKDGSTWERYEMLRE